MIQITLKENEPLARLIEARANQSGKTVDETAGEVLRESLYNLVYTLHNQFMRGEISQGRLAELLGISRVDLIHLLEDLKLAVTNL